MIFVYKLRKDSTWMPIYPHSWQNVLTGSESRDFRYLFFRDSNPSGPLIQQAKKNLKSVWISCEIFNNEMRKF